MKTTDELNLRKLRKKLRQIENLERITRTLTSEEEFKISKKHDIRSELLELLSSCSQDGTTSGPMTTALGGSTEQEISLDTSHDDQWIQYHDDIAEDYEKEGNLEEEEENEENILPTGQTDEEKMKRLTASFLTHEEQESHSDAQQEDGDVSPPKKPKHEPKSLSVGSSQRQVPKQSSSKQQCQDQISNKSESKPVNPLKQLQRQWVRTRWTVARLEGHHDLVCSVDLWGRWLLTGSRDTTVRFWDTVCETELRSMGGHTGTVSSVILIQPHLAHIIAEELSRRERVSLEPETCLGVSGSLDCSIKVWNLSSGEQVRSFYAYSPVTQLTFGEWKGECRLLSGSAGGKVELWDMEAGCTSHSVIAHEDAITGLQIRRDQVYSASADGVISVFQIRDRKLHTIFVSENVKLSSGIPLLWRRIHSIATANDVIYYGDDAMNIKVLDWRHGVAHKLSNHTTEFGTTDALSISGDLDLLVSSGYDLDNGLGFLNVRHLPDERYLCSLCDEATSRIMTISCAPTYPHDAGLTIATGGMELSLWKQVTKDVNQSCESVYRAQYVAQFSRPARHSDMESDTEADFTEEGDEGEEEDISHQENDEMSPPFSRRSMSSEDSRGWFSWCSIL